MALAATAVGARATGVFALWMRLRYRELSDRERRVHLVAAIRALPSGGEITERFGDGATLVVKAG